MMLAIQQFRSVLGITLLCLLTEVAIGQDLMTVGEVFDYSVGDEFHYTTNISNPPSAQRKTIIGKFFSANMDTVFYERLNYRYWSQVVNNPTPHLVYHDTLYTDTISYTDLDSSISTFDNYFMCSDTSWALCDTIIEQDEELCDILVNRSEVVTMNNSNGDNIIHQYGRGLGLTWNYYWSGSSPPPMVLIDHGLFYFKKDSIECGTPDTLNVGIPEQESFGSLQSWPNPSKGDFQLIPVGYPTGEGELRIFDLYGREVHIRSGYSIGLNRVSGLSAGSYLLRYRIGNHIFTGRHLVVPN